MSDKQPAEMQVRPPTRSVWRNLSAIWIVPLLALVVTLGIAWQSYADRGTLITISFANASGVLAGETTLRYRDVVIGTVETVGFSAGLAEVEVGVRVDNNVLPYLDEDAQFWVVRPQVTASGISGLSTVLSGVYIEGDWDDVPGAETRSFRGADAAPLIRPGERGTRIVLRTDDGTTITAGAPILYRGIKVGQLERPRLTETGTSIIVDAFIEAPHDRLVTTASRFWDASGFSVSFGAAGFELDVNSLASLVSGGVSFDRVYSGGSPIQPGQIFDIYPDEAEARRRPFLTLDESIVRITVRFEGSVSGLANGAEVTYRGLPVGQVSALRSELESEGEDQVLSLKADLVVDPRRLGMPNDITPSGIEQFFADAVEDGLRARLATASLFGTELIVELVELPEADPAVFEADGDPYPILPSVQSDVPSIASSAQGVLNRIDALPIEELLQQAISVMDAIEDVARAEGTRQAPDAVLALVEDTRALIGSDATQAIPAEVQSAIAELRAVVAELREENAAQALADALRAVDSVSADVSAATEGLPELLEELRMLAAKANDLPVEDLVASANGVLNRADTLLASEDTQALPGALGDALEGVEQAVAEARAIMGELQTEGAVAALTSALQSADRAATDLSTASEDLPALVEDLREVAATANALPLQDLVAAANRVLASADALVSSEDTQDLPVALTGALEQVEAALAELRAGGTVENVNQTLASARGAADAVAQAANDLPQLTARLNQLVRQSEALLATYGDRSAFSAQTLGALRDVSDAAKAVSRLAREIERNPNSLLFGR